MDASTVHNGCLEFASGRHEEGFIGLTSDGVVSQEEEDKMEFTPCEVRQSQQPAASSQQSLDSKGNCFRFP